jgi:hypothetical protein
MVLLPAHRDASAGEEMANGKFEHRGELRDAGEKQTSPIAGLWALQFGHGSANNGPTNTLFFTAGPNDESDGLFGSITAPWRIGGVAARRWPRRQPALVTAAR